MTFQRIEAIAAALLAALALAGLGGYVLFTHKDTAGLWVGVPCILLALAIVLPVQLKAGARNLKDAGHDVHKALVVIVPTIVADAVAGGDRRTDPPADIEIPPHATEDKG